MTSAGGRCPTEPSLSFFLLSLGGARGSVILSQAIWLICLGLRDEQPATRGDATVIEFMQNAARSHAGAGWLAGWLADEQPGGVATAATATVLLPYIAHHPILNHLLSPPPLSAPPPVMLCDGRLPQGHIRAVLLLPLACLLCCCASVGQIWGPRRSRATYSLGVYFPKTRSAATGDGMMMMMMDGNGVWRGGPGEGGCESLSR